ncbi:MBL fold metallo-hydrolase [Bacillus cereus]|uniref:MBL fold metallo-hydrolase n=1 Tax=Bacillus cereus TaxID=1396 RepID=UPI000BFCEC85|nr:MBL fold metallo-hydrolase [Bacillus cereus]PGT10219.1 ribonuclease Z [Bacillus cereus]
MLNFIGRGSAFNTKEGNNCAYIKKDNHLFLIDCGSSTFGRLIEYKLLDEVKQVTVLLTHLHPDHVGSLGDLIFYGYYSMGELMKPSVTVCAPYDLKIVENLKTMGVERNTYELLQFGGSVELYYDEFTLNINTVWANHVEELSCFGYIIKICIDGHKHTIYYSGDSNDIPLGVLFMLEYDQIDYFYQDTCIADYEKNVHLSLRKLDELIKQDVRHKVFCMHLDEKFDEQKAKDLGFNVVSIAA